MPVGPGRAGPGRVGPGRAGSGQVGLGRAGSGRAGSAGSEPSLGRGRAWARSFPQDHVAGRMRTHAGTRACTHLPASRCCGGLSDVKRCSMFVSGMFGQQSFGKTSFSTIAGCRLFFWGGSVAHEPSHLLRYRRSFKLKERTQQSRSVTTGITNPCRNRMVVQYGTYIVPC